MIRAFLVYIIVLFIPFMCMVLTVVPTGIMGLFFSPASFILHKLSGLFGEEFDLDLEYTYASMGRVTQKFHDNHVAWDIAPIPAAARAP